MEIRAWAPGHATLFFSVPQKFDDPLKMGSLGAGFNFNTGVLTSVEPDERDQVYWNNKPIDGRVTLTVVDKFRELFGEGSKLRINHQSELKIGHGLSTSGAGSIGTVLCLNKLYKSNISKLKLFQIAHYADAVNHTGLGSVMGQITKGIEIREKQGGPGLGKTKSIVDHSDIIILQMDKLKTSDVLVSDQQMAKVNQAGLALTEKIDQIADNFAIEILKLGREFAIKCGLMTNRVKTILDDLDEMGEVNTSMAMIGETIIVIPKNTQRVVEYAFNKRIDTVVTKISDKLPHIIE